MFAVLSESFHVATRLDGFVRGAATARPRAAAAACPGQGPGIGRSFRGDAAPARGRLTDLDDRTLRDIGLSRAEAELLDRPGGETGAR